MFVLLGQKILVNTEIISTANIDFEDPKVLHIATALHEREVVYPSPTAAQNDFDRLCRICGIDGKDERGVKNE